MAARGYGRSVVFSVLAVLFDKRRASAHKMGTRTRLSVHRAYGAARARACVDSLAVAVLAHQKEGGHHRDHGCLRGCRGRWGR